MVAHRVIEDDSLVRTISATWASTVAPGRIEVQVASAGRP
jgi:hypothetical protein